MNIDSLGRVWMGRQAVDQGYDRTRIATHVRTHVRRRGRGRRSARNRVAGGLDELVGSSTVERIRVRAARQDELTDLQRIEVASGAPFREIGMDDIADNPPLGLDILARCQREGRAWVGVDAEDQPVAFVVVDLVDGCAHVQQLSVHPDHARQGIGRRLLDHVSGWAAGRGLPALTLTTFRTVPWNAPYYARCGFTELAPAEITPELADVLAAEAAMGLDPTDRVGMRRAIG